MIEQEAKATNTPTGVQECCGYEDCHFKECEGNTSVNMPDGTIELCCGKTDCSSKVPYLPAPFCRYLGIPGTQIGGFPEDFYYSFKLSDIIDPRFALSYYISVGCGNASCNVSVNGRQVIGLWSGLRINVSGSYSGSATNEDLVFASYGRLNHFYTEFLSTSTVQVCVYHFKF